MKAFFDRLINLDKYPRQADKDRVRMVVGVTIFIMVLFTLYMLLVPQGLSSDTLVEIALRGDVFMLVGLTSLYVIPITMLFFTRAGRLDIAVFAPSLLWLASAVLIGFRSGFSNPDGSLILCNFLVLATIFAREKGLRFAAPVAVVVFLFGVANYNASNGNGLKLDAVASILLQLIGISSILFYFLNNTRLSELEYTSEVSGERIRLAALTTEISSNVLRRTSLGDTLNGAVNTIRQQYPKAYHVQIFLLDENRRNAKLAASTGEVGRILLEREHSLPVGSVSVIGQVTSKNENVISRAGSTSVHKRNELLPETQVEGAFPLRLGNNVIGALDMQSKDAGAFAEGDIPIFQSMADQIAIAIDNARLFDEIETRAHENEKLVGQANDALREVERLNRQLTAQSWSNYVADNVDISGASYDFEDNIATKGADLTPTLSEAIRHARVTQRKVNDGVVISAPIFVRGQVIGALEFEIEGETLLETQEVELITSVTERLGLTIEAARLYEVSRRSAQKEATLNTISSRLQATNTIDSVLGEAARGLQESLGANKVAIRLGAPPKTERKPNGSSKGNGV